MKLHPAREERNRLERRSRQRAATPGPKIEYRKSLCSRRFRRKTILPGTETAGILACFLPRPAGESANMAIDELITELGYADSPHFLQAEGTGHFSQTVDYGHIFRRAADRCGLQGVYTLQRRSKQSRDAIVPVVYVCKADDDRDADRIHRLVWNQNIAPFLIIVSRRAVRLYSGFRYAKPGTEADPERSGLLRAAETFRKGDVIPGLVSGRPDRQRLRLG